MRVAVIPLLALALPALGEEQLAPAQPSGQVQLPRVLTLADAIGIARANQPQLRQARANTVAAFARADEARAPLLPQLTGSANYQRTTANFVPRPSISASVSGIGTKTSWETFNFWNFGGTLSQLVWDFGATLDSWRASKSRADSQFDTERFTALQVLLSVRTSYFTARANKELVGVAQDTLKNQQAHLRQTEGFVEVGTQPEIALAQARTNVANAQVQVITAQNNYETAKAQLNQAMGIEGPTDYDVASETVPAVEDEDLSTDGLLPQALRNRPDIASLEQQIRAQQLTIGSVRGNYFPSLGVSTGVTDIGLALDSLVWNWNAQATLTWNIFQGGLTRAQSQEAQANLDALTAQIVTLRQQVRLDVEQARLAVRAAKTSLGAAADALTNAREQLRLAEGRYQVGAGNIIELSDAQVSATSAAAQRVQADYNLATARAQLLRSLGNLGPFAPQPGR